ncbi:OmpH family outer membrane protein [Oleiagrimonas sp. MCCC 1A03011]|uniref:OmpH family outer membrane protein n=1 Tax=Oleiagrimonas sp. MCCC 1A03011 TaxID=1926883 RepID=UPI000DC38ED2|nr:OmpH family outer membrane protein [Oleiagrimonas sp. MCCC 1A03011]RAP58140.1 hypothetical protein BTJ49_03915 [Oleiagrimonas sp. MCCC 1A03011]
MFSHRVVIAAALAGLFALPALPAHAQSSLGGKVAGVCMLSRDQVLAQSKVGQAASARMQQLAQQAGETVKKLREPLQKDIQQFQQQAQSMQPQQRAEKQKQLQQRMATVQQEAQQYDQRLRITRGKAMNRIGNEIGPLLSGIYKRRGCGILVDRDSVLGGNEANDLTNDVVKALDAKMSTISFSLAPLPKQNGK